MTYDVNNIVTIDLKLEKYKPKYTVVVDWPKEDVLKLAHENEIENTFTLHFYTESVYDIPDWSNFFEYNYRYLAQPFYVQNIENIKNVLVNWGFEDDQ